VKLPGREVWLVAGLLALLAGVTALAAIHQTQSATPPPLSSTSDGPDGGHALALWLGALGDTVRTEAPDPFDVPAGTQLALMLEPTTEVTPAEWRALDKWVSAGGTLVLAGDGLGAALASEHYTVTLPYYASTAPSLVALSPVLASPPFTQPALAQARAYLDTARTDALPLAGAAGQTVALAFGQGKGRVVISAAPYALTNAGLKEAGNPELALNLVSAAGQGPLVVWFDEWHHGVRPGAAAAINGPEDWLRLTPAGHALLFVAALVFVWLLLGGRRFGRPVPLPRETSRRAPLEYITAMANLQRRAGQRLAVLRHYHDQLKRRLGRRYRLDPGLPDGDYVARLSAMRPSLDGAALARLLRELSAPDPSEETLVRLAGQAADWMKP
jgi:hypothetical protein